MSVTKKKSKPSGTQLSDDTRVTPKSPFRPVKPEKRRNAMRGHGLSSGVPQAQCSHDILSTDQTH